VGETAPDKARKSRLSITGVVTSDKMQKSIVVTVKQMVTHPKYEKRMLRTTKVVAHDENNEAHIGDEVELMMTRPMSKKKRWRLVRVLKKAVDLG